MHLLLTYFHMYWRLSIFAGYIHEIHGEYDQKAQLRKRKAEMRNGEMEKPTFMQQPGPSTIVGGA